MHSAERQICSRGDGEFRPLAEIYGELAAALLRAGDELSATHETSQADARFTEAVQAFSSAIREGGSLRRYGIGLARVQERRGRPEDALRAYLDVVRSEPPCAVEVLPLAHGCLTRARARAVGRWIDSEWRPAVLGADVDPSATAAIRAFLGRVAMYRNEYRTAIEEYQAAARVLETADPSVNEGLGEALWRAGQATEAIAILENAVRMADAAGTRKRSVRIRLKLGGVYIDAGSPQTAINVLREGLALSSRWRSEFWTELARARLALGRWEGAIRAAERATEETDGLASAHATRASALLELGKYEESVKAAEAALTIDPRDPRAIRAEGRALLDGGIDREQGIRLTHQYLDQSPNDAACRVFLARAMRSAERPLKDVIALLDAGIGTEGGDKSADLYLELAQAYIDAEDAGSALGILERADLTDSSPGRSRWWLLRGDALRAKGDVPAALAAYTEASAHNPADPTALQHRASLLFEQERFAEAVKVWQRTTDAKPYDGSLKLKLAQAAQHAGDGEGAWAAVSDAIKTGVYGDDRTIAFDLRAELAGALQRPRDEVITAFYEAGRNLYWKADYERSIALLKRAMELDPEHPGARWYHVDAVRCRAVLRSPPYRDARLLEEARRRWETALGLAPPTADQAWAYVSGALIAEGLSGLRRASDSAPLVWEAIARTECSLVLEDRNIFAWLSLARLHRTVGTLGTALIAACAVERARRLIAACALGTIEEDDLGAIDELVAILANLGETEGARDLVDARRTRARNTWIDGVHAYVLYLESQEQCEDEESQNHLKDAVEQLSAVVRVDPDDLWAWSFRAECLRRLALRDPASAEDFRRRARDDYQTVWARRNEGAFIGRERTFAAAAYGLGEVRTALEIMTPLLGDPADASCDDYRLSGWCYLRLDDFERAEEDLNRGIDGALASPQLESLDFEFSEIERAAAGNADRGEMLNLLNRLRARVDAARSRLKASPDAKVELRRFTEWREAARRTHGWSWIAASAGLARLCVEAGELREAEAIYRALGQQTGYFPEAGTGLSKIVARCRELGEQALKRGWDPPAARMAIEHFEHALVIEEAIPGADRGELSVRLGLAQFLAGMEQQAAETLAAAVEIMEARGNTDPGAALGRIFRELISDVGQFWTLDDYLGSLAENPAVRDSLRIVLPQAVESLAHYLENALDIVQGGRQQMLPGVTPITVKIAKNLAVPEEQEKDWPLMKQFLPEMRDRIQDETGVQVPGVSMDGTDADLPDDTYVILLDEVPIVSGSISSAAKYCPSPAGALRAAGIPLNELTETKHPISMQSGWWVPERYWELVAKAEGCALWPDPMQFMVAHLEAVLRSNLADFVGVQEVSLLLERWGREEKGRELIAAVLLDTVTRQRFVQLLRALVRERVPITDWEGILEEIRHVGLKSDEIDDAVCAVRLRVKKDLPGNDPGAKRISVPPEIESAIMRWLTTVDGRRFLAIPPEATEDLTAKIRALVSQDGPALVLVTEQEHVRAPVRRLIESEFPSITVHWRGETVDDEQRQTPLGRIHVLAEWGEFGNQGLEAEHAG